MTDAEENLIWVRWDIESWDCSNIKIDNEYNDEWALHKLNEFHWLNVNWKKGSTMSYVE
jgi:hypothetical protein